MTTSPGRTPKSRFTHTVVIACLLLFWWLGVHTAVSQTVTVDEPAHILRGHALWQLGDLQYQFEHMPLSHWLNGSLLFITGSMSDITQLPSWPTDDRLVLAHELLWPPDHSTNIPQLLLLARLPNLLVGVVLGALLARWTWAFTRKPVSVCIVVWLFAWSPNLLASAAVATTDFLTATLFTAVIFALWWVGQRPSWRRWLGLSVVTGMALATKLTALVLLPLIVLLHLWQQWQNRTLWPPRYIFKWLVLGLVAGLVVWAVYLFEWRPLAPFPFPIPAATYFSGFLNVQEHVDSGHAAFLLGARSVQGWWYYFVVAFLVKTPASVLILLIFSLGILFWRRQWGRTIYFWLPPLLLFLAASVTRLNIGYRHILPVLPFVWLLIATAVSLIGPVPWAKWSVGLLLFMYALGSWRQQPYFLAYFNEFVGGAANGALYLGDSNLDWGQNLNNLQDYVNKNDSPPVMLSYYGVADPAYYGFDQLITIDAAGQVHNLNPANPAAGLYALSVSHLQGLGLADPDMLDWFRRQDPVQQIGYTINVYDVPAAATGEWVAYCRDPAPLLSPEESDALLGVADVRRVYFDCRQSWVLPGNGQPGSTSGSAGWYILPQQEKSDWLIGRNFPDNFHLIFRHNPGKSSPSYDVYYWDGRADVTDITVANPQILPVTVGDTAVLQNAILEDTNWWTQWQVLAMPDQPLTIAGHLYVAEPPPLVADGLGFSSEQWQPGDVFWQLHTFDQPGRYLETGLYNYLTGERLPTTTDTAVGDFIHLPVPQP